MLSITNHELKNRLLVLVPEGLVDEAGLAQKVYALALRDHRDVLYLAVVEDPDNRLSVMRRMATLSALTSSEAVNVKSILFQTRDWVQSLRDYYRPGDRVACLASQTLHMGWQKTIPVREALEKALDAPVLELAGVYHPWKTASRKWLLALLFWVGCLAILAGFSMLEFQIDHAIQGVARTALIMIALTVEFGAFWAWSHMPKM